MSEAPYRAGDRRPIAARSWRLSQIIATWLARNGASPNAISITGMICALVAGCAFAATAAGSPWDRIAWVAGVALIQLRLLANMFDGMVAIESGRASPVGELYNDVPDRIADTAVLIGAGYGAGGNVVLGFTAALAAMFTAYVRAVGRGAGSPQEFCGPMAKQQRMFIMTAIALYCGLTPAEWQPLWGDPPRWGLAAAGLLVISVGGFFTALRRLSRIAGQLRKPTP